MGATLVVWVEPQAAPQHSTVLLSTCIDIPTIVYRLSDQKYSGKIHALSTLDETVRKRAIGRDLNRILDFIGGQSLFFPAS